MNKILLNKTVRKITHRMFVCLNVKHLFYKIQQKKNSSSDGATELDFFHVKYPEGSGRAKFRHLHLDKEKGSKCSLMFFFIRSNRRRTAPHLSSARDTSPPGTWDSTGFVDFAIVKVIIMIFFGNVIDSCRFSPSPEIHDINVIQPIPITSIE